MTYFHFLKPKLQTLGAVVLVMATYHYITLLLGFREPLQLTPSVMLVVLLNVLFVVFGGAFISIKYKAKGFKSSKGKFLWFPFVFSMSIMCVMYFFVTWYFSQPFQFEIVLAAIAWIFFDSVFSLTKETKKAILKEN